MTTIFVCSSISLSAQGININKNFDNMAGFELFGVVKPFIIYNKKEILTSPIMPSPKKWVVEWEGSYKYQGYVYRVGNIIIEDRVPYVVYEGILELAPNN